MALQPNPDPNGQLILEYQQGRESGRFGASERTTNPPTGSGIGPATSAGSGLTAGAGDIDAGSGSALSGALDSVQSLAATGQQVAGFIADPASAANFALNKISAGIPAIGKIAGIAGGINNILGLFRSKNIPTSAETVFGSESSAAYVEVKQGLDEDWRIRLDCNFSLFDNAFPRLVDTSGLVWPYLPNITVISRANYTQVDPVHNIQPFQAYKNSQVEDIQISGDFSVETEADAEYWIQATTFLRTATKMFFGRGPNVGNPPVICNLTGYGSRVFNNVPVVIKSFSIDFKEDVNYMRYQGSDQSPTWVPVLSTISVTVAPVYNRTRLRKFNLQDYANGRAIGHI